MKCLSGLVSQKYKKTSMSMKRFLVFSQRFFCCIVAILKIDEVLNETMLIHYVCLVYCTLFLSLMSLDN